jgi:hypothetical protein
MDDSIFIKKNDNKGLSPITKIKRENTSLGSLKLITVCLADDFMQYSNLCNGANSPFYIKEIKETRTSKKRLDTTPFSDLVIKNKNHLYHWKKNILTNHQKHKLIDVYIDDITNIQFVKNSKSSITIYTTEQAKINDTTLEANKTYIIKFQLLDRSSSRSSEYFMHKSIIDKIPSKENIMLAHIRRYIQQELDTM